MAWNGRATKERLEQWRRDYNESFKPGNVNGHLSTDVLLHITHARIVRQRDGAVIAETTMPTFELI